MTPTIEKLLKVQDYDSRLVRLQRELHDLPERKAEIETRMRKYHDAVLHATEEIKNRQAQVRKLEGEVEFHREKIRKLREQQTQIKTNREFQAMESEVDAIQRAIGGVEDQLLEVMMGIDAGQAELRAREQELQKEDGLLEQERASLDQRAEGVGAEVARLQAERMQMKADVDPAWLERYDRIFQNRKDIALVSTANGVCGGCHMRLPPYLLHEARRQADVVVCEFCGRMLY